MLILKLVDLQFALLQLTRHTQPYLVENVRPGGAQTHCDGCSYPHYCQSQPEIHPCS